MLEEFEGKKILMLIPALGKGGAEKSFSQLSVSLAEHGNKVTVVSFDDYIQPAYPLGGEWKTLGVYENKRLIGKIWRVFHRVSRLKRLKSQIKPDISISYLEGANYLNALTKSGDKCVISCRGSITYDETIKGFWGFLRKNFLIKWLYPLADKIVVVGEGLRQELIREYGFTRPDDIEVIPSFLEKSRIELEKQETLGPKESDLFRHRVFMTHGRLAPEKGFHHLLHVFKRYRDSGGQAKLLILGDGPQKDRLRNLCEELSLSAYYPENNQELNDSAEVFMLGYKSNPYKYLDHAQLFIMTSSSEGTPNSIMEALALSVPVLSADCPYGPREILNPSGDPLSSIMEFKQAEYGCLMPSFSSYTNLDEAYSYWANGLLRFEKNEQVLLQLRANGAVRAKDFYKDVVFDKWTNLIGKH